MDSSSSGTKCITEHLILVDGAFCYRENGPVSQLAPLLAEHFTVFACDRRGRGASGDAPVYAVVQHP